MRSIEIYALDDLSNVDGLSLLPKTIEWRVLKSKTSGRLFLDHGYDPKSKHDCEEYKSAPKFAGGPLWSSPPLVFNAEHAYLNKVARNVAIGESMAEDLIHYALLVSKLIKASVFFTASDKNGHDAIIQANCGKLVRLVFCNGDEIVAVDDKGKVSRRDNQYASEEEGCIYFGLALDESYKHFGYRLDCFRDVVSDLPDVQNGDYELVAQSTTSKRQTLTAFEVGWQFSRLILRDIGRR
jgi:hypothetical protein